MRAELVMAIVVIPFDGSVLNRAVPLPGRRMAKPCCREEGARPARSSKGGLAWSGDAQCHLRRKSCQTAWAGNRACSGCVVAHRTGCRCP